MAVKGMLGAQLCACLAVLAACARSSALELQSYEPAGVRPFRLAFLSCNLAGCQESIQFCRLLGTVANAAMLVTLASGPLQAAYSFAAGRQLCPCATATIGSRREQRARLRRL